MTMSRLYAALGLSSYSYDYFPEWKGHREAQSHLAKNVNRPQQRSMFPRTFKGPQALPRTVTPTKEQTRALKPDVCVSRGVREEVMHALGHAGKGGQKSPVWTQKSKVRCK